MLADFLESLDQRQFIAGRQLFVGNTVPVNPVSGDIWVDPTQLYSNIWTYIGAGWASECKNFSSNFDGLWSTSSASPLRALIPIHEKGGNVPYSVVLRRLVLAYNMPGTAHSSTNMFTFTAFWRNASTGLASAINSPSGSPITATTNSGAAAALTYSTQNSSVNRSYHESWNINAVIGGVGTLGAIQLDCARTGTPTPIYGCTAQAYVQFLR
jgi:hypothetical protein